MNRQDTGAIIGIKGDILGAIVRIRDNQEIILGRDPYRCDLVIKGNRISRYHCSIMYMPNLESYRVVDYSLNGCFLEDNSRLNKEEPYQLLSGAEIKLGSNENVIKLG